MKALLAAVSVAVALLAAAELPAATRPSLRVIGYAPLTVAGRGFVAGERVTVTLIGGDRRTLRILASASGRFAARFAFAQPRCTAWLVRAVGSRSGPVLYRSPLGQCDPPVSAGSAPPAGGTGVAGIVSRGPITPVCVAEVPCDAPAAGVVVEVLQGGVVVSHVSTGADGRYYVLAVPGDYVVRAAGRGLTPRSAHVRSGSFVEVDFLIDTGIR